MRTINRFALATLLAAYSFAALAGPPDPTVYVVEKGKKYHMKNCKLKKDSKGMKLSEAKKKGYQPCKVCKPPM